MNASTSSRAKTTPDRPDLSDRALVLMVFALSVALIGYLIARPSLPVFMRQPGSGVLMPLAAAGAALLLFPFMFSLGKRSGRSRAPNRLFILHVVASVVGMAFVGMHAFARFEGPPLILVGCLLMLLVTGVVARLGMPQKMSSTFGTKTVLFRASSPGTRQRLRTIIDRKTRLLSKLDPAASEALFSVTLKHWLRSPFRSLAYAWLAWREARIIGERRSVSFLQAYWRPLHLLMAWLFLAGLALHVTIVTVFAGYAAGGREIYWWHLADWQLPAFDTAW